MKSCSHVPQLIKLGESQTRDKYNCREWKTLPKIFPAMKQNDIHVRGAGSIFRLVWRKSSLLVKLLVVSARTGRGNFSDLFSAVRKLLDGWNFAGIVSALTAADSISTNHQQLLL